MSFQAWQVAAYSNIELFVASRCDSANKNREVASCAAKALCGRCDSAALGAAKAPREALRKREKKSAAKARREALRKRKAQRCESARQSAAKAQRKAL